MELFSKIFGFEYALFSFVLNIITKISQKMLLNDANFD